MQRRNCALRPTNRGQNASHSCRLASALAFEIAQMWSIAQQNLFERRDAVHLRFSQIRPQSDQRRKFRVENSEFLARKPTHTSTTEVGEQLKILGKRICHAATLAPSLRRGNAYATRRRLLETRALGYKRIRPHAKDACDPILHPKTEPHPDGAGPNDCSVDRARR